KSIGRSSECFRMTAGIRSGKAIRTSVCFSGSLTSEHTREPLGRGSPSLGQERRPILLFKNEGAARALVCSGVTRSEKAFVSQCAPEAPIGVTFRQKVLRYQRTARSVLNRGSGETDGGKLLRHTSPGHDARGAARRAQPRWCSTLTW